MNADAEDIRRLAGSIHKPLRLMEVCGTHTMAAFKSGLRSLLPANVRLVSGPGCPVCVSPDEYIDKAVALSRLPDTIIATFGDMMKVPGSAGSLEKARAEGAEVRVVYSPSDALDMAVRQPGKNVVFLGVGFETTAPATAWTLKRAPGNYSVLCSHKTMPNAMRALLSSAEFRIDGFLCPGHVSAVTGAKIYDFICAEYRVPCVVAGFEAQDMLRAIAMLLAQIGRGAAEVEIQYTRSVSRDGNVLAQGAMADVFDVDDACWRGFGMIPGSGLKIKSAFRNHDAERFLAGVALPAPGKNTDCRCGDVLRGFMTPDQCPLFGSACTPDNPAGACMVSNEGACSAYYRYGR